ADRGEGREADRAGAVVLQHREVDDAHPHELRQPGEGHPALLEQLVEATVDAAGLVVGFHGHHQTSPSTSRCRREPTRTTEAAASTTKPNAHGPTGSSNANW